MPAVNTGLLDGELAWNSMTGDTPTLRISIFYTLGEQADEI